MTDIEISNNASKVNICEIVKELNINEDNVDYYGKYKAKIDANYKGKKKGKLILVTSTNPTPYGEGKTTMAIGLADAFHQLDKSVCLALREPSMGPVFGMKGGATGGGYSQVVPMDDINLHFTGDLHAISSCNNLLCAAIDNHIMQGNILNIDINNIKFRRCLDINDRCLREVCVGMGKDSNGVLRNDSFTITAASEIMALFCLAKDINDLKERLGNIIIAYNNMGEAIYAKDLNIEGALTVILKDAFNPNLVQTLEHTPCLIHGGPFANIAHGCNSLIATKMALSISDYVITEAGFGADLGAFKFFDIKCRKGEINPDLTVIVSTIKSLKYNGGADKENIYDKNNDYLIKGLGNLGVHIENLKKFNIPLVVVLNKYGTDSLDEISIVRDFVSNYGIDFEISTSYADGGIGAINVAKRVISIIENTNNNKLELLYDINESIKNKIDTVCKTIFRCSNVNYSEKANIEIDKLNKLGLNNLPICVAKTQYSLSDDPKLLGSPKDFSVTVKDVIIYNGAGFITVLLGNIMVMPGLNKKPNYENIDLDVDGNIVGLF